jgi:hypothetical protein
LIAQEDQCQHEHQHRSDQPVLHQLQAQDACIGKASRQLLVADLRQWGYIIRISPTAIGIDVVPS